MEEMHICTSDVSRRNTGQVVYKGYRVKFKVTGAKKVKKIVVALRLEGNLV